MLELDSFKSKSWEGTLDCKLQPTGKISKAIENARESYFEIVRRVIGATYEA